jgi:hypothetical protein
MPPVIKAGTTSGRPSFTDADLLFSPIPVAVTG